MLSTATMVRLGYVTGNRMTNVHTRNAKLRARALRILQAEARLTEANAKQFLDSANGDLPLALVMSKTGCSRTEAELALRRSQGVIAGAVDSIREPR